MRLRKAMLEDCGLVWVWSNDRTVRRNSFTKSDGYISWPEHIDWYRGRLCDIDCQFYIVVDDGDNPIGQTRLQFVGDRAEISISIAAPWRGCGRGSEAIRLTSELGVLHGCSCIVANVKGGNSQSLRAFEKAGYVKCDETVIKGQKNVVMMLDKVNR